MSAFRYWIVFIKKGSASELTPSSCFQIKKLVGRNDDTVAFFVIEVLILHVKCGASSADSLKDARNNMSDVTIFIFGIIIGKADRLDELVRTVAFTGYDGSSYLSGHVSTVRIQPLVTVLKSDLKWEYGGGQVVRKSQVVSNCTADSRAGSSNISGRSVEALVLEHVDRNIAEEFISIGGRSSKPECRPLFGVTHSRNLERYFLPLVRAVPACAPISPVCIIHRKSRIGRVGRFSSLGKFRVRHYLEGGRSNGSL